MFADTPGEVPTIIWTAKCYRSYFGMYHSGDNHIEINRLLNSPDVPVEAVKYIIYHELLHREYWKHDKAFRMQEHLYPNWTEQERFLDFTFPKFDLENAF
jgi:predicted metal-dependent hydrolase